VLTLRVTARLAPGPSARLAALATGDDDEADGGEPSALALIKSVPRNVSLESMLTEIGKLDAVRVVGLPDGLVRRCCAEGGRRLAGPRRGGGPSHLRDQSRLLMLTMLATLVYERRRITHSLLVGGTP
jgi:hypothetical protein